MRATLQAVFASALASAAALLLAAALAPDAHAQAAQRQTHTRRTTPPSSTTTPSARTQTRYAQTPRAGETDSRAEESGVQPDLSITAHVTADSLRFEKVPNPKVEFTGQPRRDTVWHSDRENLPQEVRPGVTYRNIGITLRITSVFADIDRIVAEALGEVPAGDDARPTPAPPASTPPSAQPLPTPPAQPLAQGDSQTPAASASQESSATQESRPAQTPSPAKAPTRAGARVRHERRGRGL